MANKLNVNAWVMTIFVLILALAGMDWAHSAFDKTREKKAVAEASNHDPGFKVGDIAPDFTLPDRTGGRQTLSQLVNGDTYLMFICGCSRCRATTSYLSRLLAKRKGPRPTVLSVASFDPESEEAYLRDTHLQQTLLYTDATSKDAIEKMYKGHPCPRVFHLDGNRKVLWISASPKDDHVVNQMGHELGHLLGYRYPHEVFDDNPNAPIAPEMEPAGMPSPPAGMKMPPGMKMQKGMPMPGEGGMPEMRLPPGMTAPRHKGPVNPPLDPKLPPYMQTPHI